MNEITRIHLAKVAYDIEVSAKKHLQKYIKELEEHVSGVDVLTDIEIRMTELLSERRVKAGGVITNDDVAAVRKQLGEPYEFAEEDGDIAVGPVETDPKHKRRFFRDTHGAILGGVLSGIALYAKVDALWVRIGFILILIGSFGFAFFGYLIMWAIVPPAKSATDRLRQAGKPVTIASIRALKEDAEAMQPSRVAPAIMRALSIVVGSCSLLAGLAILTLMVVGSVAVMGGDRDIIAGFSQTYGASSTSWVAVAIGVFGLLLLVTLFGLITYALFAYKVTKRILVSAIVIVALGITSAIAVAGIVSLGSWQMSNQLQELTKVKKFELPANFEQVDSVVFELKSPGGNFMGASPNVHYNVETSGTPRYELVALPGAKVRVAVEGTVATISLELPKDSRNAYVQSNVTMYGPALKNVTARNMYVSYLLDSQESPLTVTTDTGSRVYVSGYVGAVTAKGNGAVDLNDASVTTLDVIGKAGINITAGTIESLTITAPGVCPTGDVATHIYVDGVTSGAITYNGNKRKAVSYETNCIEIIVENDSSRDY